MIDEMTKAPEREIEDVDPRLDSVYKSTANDVLIDCDLGVIAAGNAVTEAFGTIRSFTDLSEFVSPKQAFRLEQFIIRKTPFDRLPTLEIAVAKAPAFKCAVAYRQTLFDRSTVLLRFYHDKRDQLTADKLAVKYCFRTKDAELVDEALDNTERIISQIEKTLPDEAASLRMALAPLLRESLAHKLIESVITPSKNRECAIDVKDISKSAANYVKRSFAKSAITTSVVTDRKRKDPVISGISPDHLWNLTACALTSLVGASVDGHIDVNLKLTETDLITTFETNVGDLASGLPCSLTLGELREILPLSTMRLYLCDLICAENGMRSEAAFSGERMKLIFDLDLTKSSQQFHRFETYAAEAMISKIVTDAVIITDEAKTA